MGRITYARPDSVLSISEEGHKMAVEKVTNTSSDRRPFPLDTQSSALLLRARRLFIELSNNWLRQVRLG